MDRIEKLARAMYGIARERRAPAEGLKELARLSLPEAYAVQRQCLELRAAEGERAAGWKAGCTSAAIQRQFGLQQPIAGRLLAPQLYASGVALEAGGFVEPAVEAELVLRLRRDLAGEVDEAEAAAAIEVVAAGIEWHNYHFWSGEPTSQELIASNGIHAGLVIGPEQSYRPELDLAMEGVGLWVNGELAASGLNAEILGRGPLASLCWLARYAAERGERLRAGEWVIPGSAVRLVRVKSGDRVEARFTRLGECAASLV